jgi:GT2 family glycosyltransferase
VTTSAHDRVEHVGSTAGSGTAVIVLNWNNAPDTLACLRSLRRSTRPVTTIVVDNASADGSAAEIEASGLADVLLASGGNLGYAGGNNVGLRYAVAQGFREVMVLNNDTIVPEATVEQLVRALDAQPGPSAVSPAIFRQDSGDLWFGGGILDRGWPRFLQHDELSAGFGSRVERTQWHSG